jgi:hypothetical protein
MSDVGPVSDIKTFSYKYVHVYVHFIIHFHVHVPVPVSFPVSVPAIVLVNAVIHVKVHVNVNAKFFLRNCFWWTRKPFLYLFSFATPQRTSDVKYHPRWPPIKGLAVYCRLGRLPDLNPRLQVYSLVLLPLSHHYSSSQSCMTMDKTLDGHGHGYGIDIPVFRGHLFKDSAM